MQLTLADMTVYNFLDFFKCDVVAGAEDLNKNYPDLVKFHKGITEDSDLTEYIKTRPKTIY